MKISNYPSACIYALAEHLIERMEYNPEHDDYRLPSGTCITAPKAIVEMAKKEFETQNH